jgi:hypothetical protein
MRRLCILLCLVTGPGCLSDDATKRQLDAALKDARGENMQMRGRMDGLNDSTDMPSLRPRN